MFNIVISSIMILSSILLIYSGFTFKESRVKKEIKNKESCAKFQRKFGKIIGFTGLILSLMMLVEERNEMFLGLDFESIVTSGIVIFIGEICVFAYKSVKYL
ncbi:MAG: hypothetical protein ACRC1T_16605 [Clostridium chrysemydis]|uniref:hypothetical protein n=1 Tax=Clostridium chrysemydis TaxID=2665504 RepID=UPI003F2CA08A